MISGFAKAGRLLNELVYTERALQAVEFLRSEMYLPEEGVLLRSSYVDGGDRKHVIHRLKLHLF